MLKKIKIIVSLVLAGFVVVGQRVFAATGLDDLAQMQGVYGSPQTWITDDGGGIVTLQKTVGTIVLFWLAIAFVAIGIQRYLKHRRRVKSLNAFSKPTNYKL